MDGQNYNNGQNDPNSYNNYTSSQYFETYSEGQGPSPSTPGLSIAGLVLGILSIVVCCLNGGGIIFAVPGIIVSVLGNRERKSGVGTAGLICSIVGTIFNAIVLFIVVLFYIVAGGIKNMIL